MAGASTRLEARWRRAIGLCVAALALLSVGCGQGDPPFPAPPGGEGGHTSGGGPGPTPNGYGTKVETGLCALEDEVRECHVLIGQHAGITNCFNGIQRCVKGEWTRCKEGTYTAQARMDEAEVEADPRGLELIDTTPVERAEGVESAPIHAAPGSPFEEDRPLDTALTTLKSCMDPCDPTCRSIIEDTPYTVTGVALSAWATAASAALPSRKASMVTTSQPGLWIEPCAIDADCQFGMQCLTPVTRNLGSGAGQCAHDKCALGVAMSATCGDPCIAKICAKNPDCCTYTGSCAHAPCLPGAALTCQAGDPNVAAVCADPATAYCCDTATGAWNAACVAAYGTLRGFPCPADPVHSWTSAESDAALSALRMTCTQLAHDQCGVTCTNNTPTCAHDLCQTGTGLTAGCDSAIDNCVSKVCATNASCCGAAGTWTQACIDAIPMQCGKACSAAAGTCRLMLPNEVDPECGGYDLVTNVPCFDGNLQQVPGLLGKACTSTPACSANTPVGTTCTGNICTKTCTTDAECVVSSGGVVCDAGLCKPGCRNTSPCPTNFTCTSTTSAFGECRQFKVPGNSTARSYAIICNIGTQPTPLNTPVTVNVYGGYSTPATTWPALPPAGATPTRTCSTAAMGSPQILPGKCIDLPCLIDQNDVVYVNPPNPVAPYAASTQLPECHASFGNNWAMNLDGTVRGACDAPICSLQNGTIRSLKTHVVIEAENSSAMQANTWSGIRSGVIGFTGANAGNPWTVADVSAAIGYFPDDTENCVATGAGSCGPPPSCIKFGMDKLSFWSVILNALLTIFQPMSAAPPPYLTALRSALEHSRIDRLSQVPGASGQEWNSSVILVMGSDVTAAGNSYCGSTVTTLSGLAAEYYAKYGIRTFVVAVGAAKLTTAQAIARAGAGEAYYVANDANTGNNVTKALLDATAYSDQSCQFGLPPVSLFDQSGTTVRLLSPAGPNTGTPNYRYSTQTYLNQVTPAPGWSGNYLQACLANCANLPNSPPASPGQVDGWCYDDPTNPTRIVLCADTCRASTFDPYASLTSSGAAHSQITYTLACPSYYANITYPTPGAYQGMCPDIGMKPLWSYLGYQTVAPTNTNVTFQFQTAQAVNGACPPVNSFPAPNTFKVVAGPTNNECDFGMGGGCPIDLVNAMNGGKINGPMLSDCMNLTVSLNPNPQHTFTPEVKRFELRYSCPYVE